MKFNECLKSLIKESGLTNAELARRIGVHKSYITQLINSHCNPPSKHRCNQIADVLGCKEHERTELLFSAIEGRMSDDVLEFFNMLKGKAVENHLLWGQGNGAMLQDEPMEDDASPALYKFSKEFLNLIEERKNHPKIEKHPVEKMLENILLALSNAETVDYSQERIGESVCDVLRFGNTVITKGCWEANDSVKQTDHLNPNLSQEQRQIITMIVGGSVKVRFAKTNGNGKEHIIHENSALCFPAKLGYEMITLTRTYAILICTDLN